MVLSVANVSKRFGQVIALQGVNFSVAPGEVRALFGGNGSGKSTLAKIVAGATRPDDGTVDVDGERLSTGSPAAAHKAGVALTFQELSLFPNLTVAQNLTLARIPRVGSIFRDDQAIQTQSIAILRKMMLAHLTDVPVGALRVGEKYLVELAKALVFASRYLVLDELTSALHEHEVRIVKRVLLDHCAGGGGAIVVSHRLNEVREICDTITILRNGRRVADGRLESFKDTDLVAWVSEPAKADCAHPQGQRARSAGKESARVRIRNLRLRTSDAPIDLDIEHGEILGLGGLPEQGQEDIVDVLFGLRQVPEGAEIQIDGQPARLKSPTGAVRQGIAYVCGDREEVGFAVRSIEENIAATAMNRNRRQPIDRTEFKRLLSSLSTRYTELRAPLNSLSGGNQQKVLLARCFLVRPKILLAVDPTKGIDIGARAEVHASIRKLASDVGTAVIFTSSDDRELASLCDRVIVLERRRVVAELCSGVNLSEQSLIQSYLYTRDDVARRGGALERQDG